MQNCHLLVTLSLVLMAGTSIDAAAQGRDPAIFPEQSRIISARMETRGLAEPFKGITARGQVVEGLFPIQTTGADTGPIREAAAGFLQSLSAEQRRTTQFPVDDMEWRKWGNQSIYLRQGIAFDAMSEGQKTTAWQLLKTALSVKGLGLARDIMHLNETLGELNNNNFVEFGEGKYWLTFMGEPSATQPWGWQLDGHHLVLNYFVLADQVVMTPAFWGSEPAVATTGKYAGTRIMDAEQRKGLAMIRALDAAQRQQAILRSSKTGNNIMTEAFSDNVVLDYAGVSVAGFSPEQKALLMDLVGLYTGNMSAAQAELKMAEITRHLDATWFAWIGATEDDSVFYYRIQSPVVLIEFDHEVPVGLTQYYPPGVPYREHIHAVVRTPNGNDYGKDLLRQHYEAVAH
ncbi:MAG: DUF3500 domain-containing protein [Pseudomonadales bacterium]|nr:DUF3500 domain-containing protein [Pseudomonadales bacterium]